MDMPPGMSMPGMMDMPGMNPSASSSPASPSAPMPPMDMGSMGSGSMGPMQMTFYWGTDVTLLFSGWTSSEAGGYVLALFLCFLFAIVHEGVSTVRCSLACKSHASHVASSKEDCQQGYKAWVPPLDWLLTSLAYGVNAATSYVLMLLIMSFNGGVMIAVILGHTAGVYLFGFWRRSSIAFDGNAGACCV